MRCNIYISGLCYDVSVHLSVRLSVTFVHCGHRVQWISDIFACLDRWMSLLLTNNASPGSSDGMIPGFLVEEGRSMDKLVIVAISLNLLTESLLDGWTGNSNDGFVYMLTFIGFFNLMHYIWRTVCTIELPTSRAMLATARPSCLICKRTHAHIHTPISQYHASHDPFNRFSYNTRLITKREIEQYFGGGAE